MIYCKPKKKIKRESLCIEECNWIKRRSKSFDSRERSSIRSSACSYVKSHVETAAVNSRYLHAWKPTLSQSQVNFYQSIQNPLFSPCFFHGLPHDTRSDSPRKLRLGSLHLSLRCTVCHVTTARLSQARAKSSWNAVQTTSAQQWTRSTDFLTSSNDIHNGTMLCILEE